MNQAEEEDASADVISVEIHTRQDFSESQVEDLKTYLSGKWEVQKSEITEVKVEKKVVTVECEYTEGLETKIKEWMSKLQKGQEKIKLGTKEVAASSVKLTTRRKKGRSQSQSECECECKCEEKSKAKGKGNSGKAKGKGKGGNSRRKRANDDKQGKGKGKGKGKNGKSAEKCPASECDCEKKCNED